MEEVEYLEDASPILQLLVETALALKKKGEMDVSAGVPMVVVPYFELNAKGVVVMKNRPVME